MYVLFFCVCARMRARTYYVYNLQNRLYNTAEYYI
jgi:hypothetical protein